MLATNYPMTTLAVIAVFSAIGLTIPVKAMEQEYLCDTVKETNQVIPHLFEPQEVLNGNTEFSYQDTGQFLAVFDEDGASLKIRFMNSHNQPIEHNYSCEQFGNRLNMNRCSMSPLDTEYVISFGSLFAEKIKFISYSLYPLWLTTDYASSMRVEVGFCEMK